MNPKQIERLRQEVMDAAMRGRPMTNGEVGVLLRFTLAEAYRLAHKGEAFSTIDPVEFVSMTAEQRRHHRRMLKRIARRVAR